MSIWITPTIYTNQLVRLVSAISASGWDHNQSPWPHLITVRVIIITELYNRLLDKCYKLHSIAAVHQHRLSKTSYVSIFLQRWSSRRWTPIRGPLSMDFPSRKGSVISFMKFGYQYLNSYLVITLCVDFYASIRLPHLS